MCTRDGIFDRKLLSIVTFLRFILATIDS